MYVPRHLRADALWHDMKQGKRKTHLLLTGGGALGAFQAGQLVSLLLGEAATNLLTLSRTQAFLGGKDSLEDILSAMPEPWFEFASLSGVSAGACNAAIAGTHLSENQGKVQRLQAAAHLMLFWLQDVPSMPSQLFYGRFHAMSKMPVDMKSWLDYVNLLVKPVPAEINPIITAIEKHADFHRLRHSNLPVYVAVTDVNAEKPIVLTNQNLSARMIAASGAIDEWGMQAVDGFGEGAYHFNPFMHFLYDDKERIDKDPDCALLLRLDHNLVASSKRTAESRQAAALMRTFHKPVQRDIERIRRKNKDEGRVIRLFESGIRRAHRFEPQDKGNTSANFLARAYSSGLEEGAIMLEGMPKKRI